METMRTLALILILVFPTFAQNADYISIFETPSVSDKKEIWHTLTKDERDEVRRLHYAWSIEHLELSEEKIDYLERFSKALITKEEIRDFETEAIDLFTRKEGLLLFGSIGPYEPCREIVFIPQSQQAGNCNCNMTSSFNLCSGTCGPSVCRVTDDGCGFGWLHPCASVCVSN